MFDLLIKGARIVDGTGASSWIGDVAVEDGRFAALDHNIEADARRLIQAGGYALAPGFIDIHCHSDFALFENPQSDIKLKQGVTLDVLGNCGESLAPLNAESRALIKLADVVGRRGGFYASHIRNEAEGVIDALDEVIRIGREGQVPVHVSHLKVAGCNNWHLGEPVVEKIEKARADGIDITCDVYPLSTARWLLTAKTIREQEREFFTGHADTKFKNGKTTRSSPAAGCRPRLLPQPASALLFPIGCRIENSRDVGF